ncbi:MAG: MCE family protein [Aeromicrobium sp.]
MRRVILGLVLASLTGCGYRGAASLPLPGGVGGDGYRISMVFDDVTNLVPQETCRTGDVVVGTVESITLRSDLKAEVVCRVQPGVKLAANAAPTLRETSLLGERFVALDPPTGERATGALAPGSALPAGNAHVVPDVEVVLGALSQLLNGGGLDNIETITRELSTALSGADLGDTTRTVARLVKTLNDHRSDIVRALDGLDRLSAELSTQRRVIASALDSVPSGLDVLDEERPQLVRTLEELGQLSDTATPFLRATRADTVADFEHLAVILENLAASKHRLATALESLGTFPFPSYSKYVTKGDFAGMYGLYALDFDSFNKLLAQRPALPAPPGAPAAASPQSRAATAGTPGIRLPNLAVPKVVVPDLALPDRVVDNLLGNLPMLQSGKPAVPSGGAR